MDENEQRYYTIGETSRLTGIPAQTLRRWADAGRIPHERSEKGYRHFAASVVEELRRHGLEAFKPHDWESQAQPHPVRSSPIERLGLLAEPSQELRDLKDELEKKKTRLDIGQVDDQLDERNWHREEERRQRQLEEEARAEAAEAERKREELRAEQAVEEARERQRRAMWEKARDQWLNRQLSQAAGRLRRRAFWLDLDTSELDQALVDLNDMLTEALADFSHESAHHEVSKAQDEVTSELLRPFERRKGQNKIIEECRRDIEWYVREQRTKGWLEIQGSDIDFLARQLEKPVMALVEKAVRSKGLSEAQAKEYLRDVIDRRLDLI